MLQRIPAGGRSTIQSEGSDERYTSAHLIAQVRVVLREIDVDPASSREANRVVRAKSIFTRATNGLTKPWPGRVFLNPPFSNWPAWIDKLNQELEAQRTREAVVIGPSNVAAFRLLIERGGRVLVPTKRIKFHDGSDPPFGSLLAYVGQNQARFIEVFASAGPILGDVRGVRIAKAS